MKIPVCASLAILMLIATTVPPVSAGFGDIERELREGETVVLTFENPENSVVALSVTNVNWLGPELPLFINPASVQPLSTAEINVHFIRLTEAQKMQIPNGYYAVKVVGGESEIIIYLVVENSGYTEQGPHENAAENSGQVGALENKFNQLVQRLADVQGEIDGLRTDAQDLGNNIAEFQIALAAVGAVAVAAVLGFVSFWLRKKPELKKLSKITNLATGLLGLKKREPEREAPQDENVERA